MGLFDFLFVEEHDKVPEPPPPPSVPRHKSPSFSVVLDNTESGRTASWGTDGVDIRGIKQRFAVNASTGGTILEGPRFIGSFTGTVTGQTADLLSVKFVNTDNALRKRLATPPSPGKR